MDIIKIEIRPFTPDDYVNLYHKNLYSNYCSELFDQYKYCSEYNSDNKDMTKITPDVYEDRYTWIFTFENGKEAIIYLSNVVNNDLEDLDGVLLTPYDNTIDFIDMIYINDEDDLDEKIYYSIFDQLKECNWGFKLNTKEMTNLSFFFDEVADLFIGEYRLLRCIHCDTLSIVKGLMFQCTFCKGYVCDTESCRGSSLYCHSCYYKKEY